MGTLRSLAIFAVAISTVALVGLHAVDASAVATDFEGFALGEVHGQAGWTSGHGSSFCPVYDVAVVSNDYDQTFSPSLVDEAEGTSADTSPFLRWCAKRNSINAGV